MSENLSKLSSRKGLTENLFESLIQTKGDSISLKKLATEYKVGEANLFAAASSYDFIQGENANKKAYLCNGSACLCANTQQKVKQLLLENIKENEIGHMTCLGRCHENSAFQINGVNYSGEDQDCISEILSQSSTNQKTTSKESYQTYCDLDKPVLTKNIGDLKTYYSLFSQMRTRNNKNDLLEQVIKSGLRGRGGAGFPTGIKWQSCANETADEKYIVCNADEGDPGAYSDRYLLEERPHSILFGMLVSGYLTGAQWGVIYIRDEYPESVIQIQNAIKEFESLKLLVDDFQFSFKIIRGAGAYICGEETALLRSIEGQKPMVSVRPPFPTVKGLFGKPTVVNNVETFASIHWIFCYSAQDFAQLGKGRSTGTKLLSLDSSFCNPGIYEVEMGETLAKVIETAGGYHQDLKALHIGGPLGGLVPTSKISQLSIDFESFSEAGFLLGHGSVIGIPTSFSLPKYVEHLFEFTAAESCGKCFPCRLGAIRGKEMFHQAINGEHLLNKNLLNDLLETMEQGSLCALGGGVPLPVKNALQYFPDEFEDYFDANSRMNIRMNNTRIPIVES